MPGQSQSCVVCSAPSSKECGRCRVVFYCSRPCQIKDWKDNNHKILCGGPVYIGRSSIPGAGRGVFSARAFQMKDLVCFYDGDDKPGTINHEYSMAHFDKDMTRVGFSRPVHANGVGQLLNDGACLDFVMDRLSGYVYTTDELVSAYEAKSFSRANLVFISNNFQLGAKRDIDAHEELFLAYGSQFWLSMTMKDAKQPGQHFFVPSKPYRPTIKLCLTKTRATIFIRWYKLPSAIGTRTVCAFGCLSDTMFFLPTVKDAQGVIYRVPVILAEFVQTFLISFVAAVKLHKKKSDFFPMVLEIKKQSIQARGKDSINKVELLNSFAPF